MSADNQPPNWVHLTTESNCGHGCRVVESHGRIIARDLDEVTVRLYGWNPKHYKDIAPTDSFVRLSADEWTERAITFDTASQAWEAEARISARGLGNCGHFDVPPTFLERHPRPVPEDDGLPMRGRDLSDAVLDAEREARA